MFKKYSKLLKTTQRVKHMGVVTKIVGLSIECRGPQAKMGELCYIETTDNELLKAQVVGFEGEKVFLMPFSEMQGVRLGCIVHASSKTLGVLVGDSLLGRIVDGLGNPMDNKEPISSDEEYTLEFDPPNPLLRKKIKEPLSLAVKAIDGLLSVGKGQRVGIFAGSGVGKSTLLGMIARNTKADVNVICLIGERGREVNEFIDHDLGEEGLKRSVVVISTSDRPALERVSSSQTATAIAEYFRNQGKDVMLMMDSLTRFSMAQREIGLATGEPPVARGYPPSVYAKLPRLLERTGTSDKGSITALYTVLVDGDDMNEPIADAVRGILDGHIVLSRQLAGSGHYPAIDVMQSISRVMPQIVTKEQLKNAIQIKEWIAVYKNSEDLIQIGAYAKGSNSKIDTAIKMKDEIDSFLKQSTDEKIDFEETVELIKNLVEEGS